MLRSDVNRVGVCSTRQTVTQPLFRLIYLDLTRSRSKIRNAPVPPAGLLRQSADGHERQSGRAHLLVMLLALGADHVDECKRCAVAISRGVHQSRGHLRTGQGSVHQAPHGKLVDIHGTTYCRGLFRERGSGETPWKTQDSGAGSREPGGDWSQDIIRVDEHFEERNHGACHRSNAHSGGGASA